MGSFSSIKIDKLKVDAENREESMHITLSKLFGKTRLAYSQTDLEYVFKHSGVIDIF